MDRLTKKIIDDILTQDFRELIVRIGHVPGFFKKEVPGVSYSLVHSDGKIRSQRHLRCRNKYFDLGLLFNRAQNVATEVWSYYTARGKKVTLTGAGVD